LILHNGAFVKKIRDLEARAGVGSGSFPAKFSIFPARYYIFGTVIHVEIDKLQIFSADQADAFPIADFTAKPQFGGRGGKGTTIRKETLVPEAGERIKGMQS
jgi:hypothetical protein